MFVYFSFLTLSLRYLNMQQKYNTRKKYDDNIFKLLHHFTCFRFSYPFNGVKLSLDLFDVVCKFGFSWNTKYGGWTFYFIGYLNLEYLLCRWDFLLHHIVAT